MELSSIEKVLAEETLWALRRKGMTPRDYIVLERWATNSPMLLRDLEKNGGDMLERLMRSQSASEMRILMLPSAKELMDRMPEHEILSSYGIETELEKVWKRR